MSFKIHVRTSSCARPIRLDRVDFSWNVVAIEKSYRYIGIALPSSCSLTKMLSNHKSCCRTKRHCALGQGISRTIPSRRSCHCASIPTSHVVYRLRTATTTLWVSKYFEAIMTAPSDRFGLATGTAVSRSSTDAGARIGIKEWTGKPSPAVLRLIY
jgi:hypothetical protein